MALTRNDLTKAELKKYSSYKLELQNTVIKTEEDALAAICKPQKMIYRGLIFGVAVFIIIITGFNSIMPILFGFHGMPWLYWSSITVSCALIYYALSYRRFVRRSIPRIVKVYMNEEMGGSA